MSADESCEPAFLMRLHGGVSLVAAIGELTANLQLGCFLDPFSSQWDGRIRVEAEKIMEFACLA